MQHFLRSTCYADVTQMLMNFNIYKLLHYCIKKCVEWGIISYIYGAMLTMPLYNSPRLMLHRLLFRQLLDTQTMPC